MDIERVYNFLSELSELTRKYGIEITGCGCCGSPSLNDLLENSEPYKKALTPSELSERKYNIKIIEYDKYGTTYDDLTFEKGI